MHIEGEKERKSPYYQGGNTALVKKHFFTFLKSIIISGEHGAEKDFFFRGRGGDCEVFNDGKRCFT